MSVTLGFSGPILLFPCSMCVASYVPVLLLQAVRVNPSMVVLVVLEALINE